MEAVKPWGYQDPGDRIFISAFVGTPSDGLILAHQWEREYLSHWRSPEEKLMLAVLEDALLIIARGVPSGGTYTPNARELIRRDARRWFESRNDDGVFTFNNIWSTLFGHTWSVERARKEILEKPFGVWERLKEVRGRYSRFGRGMKKRGGDEQ